MVPLGVRSAVAAVLLAALAAASAAAAPPPVLVGQMQEHDLRYIVQKLSPHTVLFGSDQAAAFRRFAARTVAAAAKPLPPWRLLLLADRLTNYFHDPHTTVYAPTTGLTMIPVGFHWVQGGLAVYPVGPASAGVEVGDSVVRLGGLTPRVLAQRLRRFFSGNPYWVRSFAGPQLSNGYLLHWLGVVGPHGSVNLLLRTPQGRLLQRTLYLAPVTYVSGLSAAIASVRFLDRFRAPLGLQEPLTSDWAWQVTPRAGIFWLTACIDSAAYAQSVDAFFRQVAAAHAPIVILDLQANGGGYSSAVFPWLHHLPGTAALGQELGDTTARPQQPPIFRGRLYVLQSWSTFSAAVVVDDLLTGDGLATSVGQPTGWSTGGWAAVKDYTTPLFGIPFQVATENFPGTYGPLPASLQPEISLPLTLRDVQLGVNPIDRWLASATRGAR